MGGHGGLNILPQKRWNVYRFDNQEKVRVDEAEAALASANGGRGAAREREPAADTKPNPKKRKKEEETRTAGPDDEKYRLGYGLAGKGVAAPWYMSKPLASSSKPRKDCEEGREGKRNGGKKSIEELREERRKREAKEKERERALLAATARKGRQPERERSSRYVRR